MCKITWDKGGKKTKAEGTRNGSKEKNSRKQER